MSDGDNRGVFDIPVLSKDPENKEDDKPKHTGEDDKATKDEKDTSEMVRSSDSCCSSRDH
jgi:hypothetical protein